MKTFLSGIIIFFAVILQVTILPKITIWEVMPNLILLLIVCQSAIKGYKEGMVWAFSCGLLLDFFSNVYFGIFSLIFLFIAFIVSFVTKKFLGKIGLLSIIIISVISTIMFDFIFLSVIKINVLSSEVILDFIRSTFPEYFIQIIFKEIIFNAFLAIIVYLLLFKFNDWLKYYEGRVRLPGDFYRR